MIRAYVDSFSMSFISIETINISKGHFLFTQITHHEVGAAMEARDTTSTAATTETTAHDVAATTKNT